MAKIGLGVNMEFVRHEDKCFEWGVEKAAEFGYAYVEPMVHWGRELLSEAGYFHSVSMLDDPSGFVAPVRRRGSVSRASRRTRRSANRKSARST